MRRRAKKYSLRRAHFAAAWPINSLTLARHRSPPDPCGCLCDPIYSLHSRETHSTVVLDSRLWHFSAPYVISKTMLGQLEPRMSEKYPKAAPIRAIFSSHCLNCRSKVYPVLSYITIGATMYIHARGGV